MTVKNDKAGGLGKYVVCVDEQYEWSDVFWDGLEHKMCFYKKLADLCPFLPNRGRHLTCHFYMTSFMSTYCSSNDKINEKATTIVAQRCKYNVNKQTETVHQKALTLGTLLQIE